MFIHMSIHSPKPGKEGLLIDSMHRYGIAIKDAPGLYAVYTLKDNKAGRLVGLAIWDSRESKEASVQAARDAVKNDPFDEWEEAVEGFDLTRFRM